MNDRQSKSRIYTYRNKIHRSTNGDILKSQHLDKRVLVEDNKIDDASFMAVSGKSVDSLTPTDKYSNTQAATGIPKYRILAASDSTSIGAQQDGNSNNTPTTDKQTSSGNGNTDSTASATQSKGNSSNDSANSTAKATATTDNSGSTPTPSDQVRLTISDKK
jgi:hypothetical protein